MQFFFHKYCLLIACFSTVFVNSKKDEGCDCEQLKTEIKLLKELLYGLKLNEGPSVAHATPALPSRHQTWSEYEYTSTYTTTVTTPVDTLVPIWLANQQVTTTISGLETVESIVTTTLTSSTLVDIKSTQAVVSIPPSSSIPSPPKFAIDPTKSMQQSSVKTKSIAKPLNPTRKAAAGTTDSNAVKSRLSLVIGRMRPKLSSKTPSSSVGGRNSFKKPSGLKKSSFSFNGRKSNGFKTFGRKKREADDPSNSPTPQLMSSRREEFHDVELYEKFCEGCKKEIVTVTVTNCQT